MARGRQPGMEQEFEELVMEAGALSREAARIAVRQIQVHRDLALVARRRSELVTA